MTDKLIRRRFFSTLHFARICKQSKSVRRDLLRIYQYAFTDGFSAGMEVR